MASSISKSYVWTRKDKVASFGRNGLGGEALGMLDEPVCTTEVKTVGLCGKGGYEILGPTRLPNVLCCARKWMDGWTKRVGGGRKRYSTGDDFLQEHRSSMGSKST